MNGSLRRRNTLVASRRRGRFASLMETTAGMTTPRSDSTFCLVGQPSNLVDESNDTYGGDEKIHCSLFPVVDTNRGCPGPFRESASLSVQFINRKARGATLQSSPFHLHLHQSIYHQPTLPWQHLLRLSHFEKTRRHLICTTLCPTEISHSSRCSRPSPAPPLSQTKSTWTATSCLLSSFLNSHHQKISYLGRT